MSRDPDRTNSLSLLRPIALSALLLLAIEVGLETRAYLRGYDTLFFGMRVPVATDQANGDETRWGPTDDFPFRSKVVDPNKPAGTVRIWIASASQAEDLRLPPDVVFPSVLERLLNERGIPTQVLNAGRAGRTIATNLDDLERGAPVWKPDIVVLYQMESGTLNGSGAESAASGPEATRVEGANMPTTGQPKRSWLTRIVEELTTYTLLKTNVTSRLAAEKQLPERLDENVIDDFGSAVERFVSVARKMGATPVISTIAISHEEGSVEEMPTQYLLVRLRFDSSVSVEGWVDSIARFNRRLHLIAGDDELQLLTLGEEIGGRPRLFRDPVHFTPTGHAEVGRVVAEQLFETLASSSELPSESVN